MTDNEIDQFLDEGLQQITVDRSQLFEAMRNDINLLAALLLQDQYLFPFPRYYQAVFSNIAQSSQLERQFTKMALGLPRGFAKTTFIKIVIIWLLLYSKKRYVLIICASEALGQKFLADIRDFLDNPELIRLVGDWQQTATKKTASDLEFSLMGRKIAISALGAGSSVRGIIRNNARPDVIVCDDIQKREDSESEVLSDQLLTWFLSTLLPVKSPFGCTYLFLANMYPTPNSLLRKLKENPDWLSFIVGGLLADGTSLWEELHPAEELRNQLRSAIAFGKPEIFLSEILNDTQSIAFMKFDASKVALRPITQGEYSHEGNFIIIDPSGDKRTSDAAAMGYFEIIDGISYLCEIQTGQWTPKQQIEAALTMAVRTRCALICVEAIAYQASLLFWLRETVARYGLTGIEVQPLHRNTAKNNAILTAVKRLQPKELNAAPELGLSESTKNQVVSQIHSFNPRKKDNVDDILDLLAYEPQVRMNYDGLIIASELTTSKVLAYNEDNSSMGDEFATSAI